MSQDFNSKILELLGQVEIKKGSIIVTNVFHDPKCPMMRKGSQHKQCNCNPDVQMLVDNK